MFNWFFPTPEKRDVEDIVKKLERIRIERDLALREAIIERKNAYQIAEARERFKWTATGGLGAAITSLIASFYHKNIIYSLPVIPAVVFVAYEAHKAYGKKLELIFHEMDNVFKNTSQRLSARLISVKEVDTRVADIITCTETMD